MCGGRQEKPITLCSKLIFLGICDMSAAMYYGYTDRAPRVWHIAVDNKSARNKFKMGFPIIKPHFIETSRLDIERNTVRERQHETIRLFIPE